MTFTQYVQKYLVDRGFFENDANEVVEIIKSAKENESMQNRWDDKIDGYPDVMLKILALTIHRHTLQWIDENKPKAWFRAFFEN